ncbi:hypothetical protein OPIT5_27695 [Opitutaceae bacterium TAV5]|nr:hypothetical protein OPIT5_27695 [Opitutaceae bacterium TAV5]
MKNIKSYSIAFLFTTLFAASQGAFAQTVVFSDDFESGNFSSPAGQTPVWTVTQNGGTTQTTVQTGTLLDGSYTAALSDSDASASGSLVASFANTAGTGSRIEVSALIRPVNDSSFSGFIAVREGFTNVARIRFYQTTGQIQYESATNAWTTLASYTSGTTYDLKLVLDFETDKYDIYINGSIVMSGLSALASVNGIDRFQVQTGLVGASQGSFYVDNVTIATPIPEAAHAGTVCGLTVLSALFWFRYRGVRGKQRHR